MPVSSALPCHLPAVRLINSTLPHAIVFKIKAAFSFCKRFSVAWKPWAKPGAAAPAAALVPGGADVLLCTEVPAPSQRLQSGAATQQTPTGAPQRKVITKQLWQVQSPLNVEDSTDGFEDPHKTDEVTTGERPRQVRNTWGTGNGSVRTLTSCHCLIHTVRTLQKDYFKLLLP